MPYGLRHIPTLSRTALGRSQLAFALFHKAGPLLYGPASFYRRVVLRSVRVVAVVGSFGKTTTARAVGAVLLGTTNRRLYPNIGGWVPLALFRTKPWQRHAVVEAGIGGPGEMHHYARSLSPRVVVVTSIGSEHNRKLKTLEVTRNEKANMVRALPRSGLAVLNGDDPNVRWMACQTIARVVTFGFDATNDVRAKDMALNWPHGTVLTLCTGRGTRRLSLPLFGKVMVYPVLAAMAVALEEGMALDQAIRRLEALEPTPGRLQVSPLANGAWLLRDDFKSAEETIDAALDVLAEVPARRRFVVLGEVSEPMGSYGTIYRRLGERIGQIADGVIFVTGRKTLRPYRAGATKGGLPPEGVWHAPNFRKAIELLHPELGCGDVVMVKGRSDQRLDRVSLALMGRNVQCGLSSCGAWMMRCERCPMLERGWRGQRTIV